MLSKIKQLIEPHREELQNDPKQKVHPGDGDSSEGRAFREQSDERHRMHIEFFYFHPRPSTDLQLSERELDRLPIMCVTVHFMEKDKPVPHWMSAILKGLEDVLAAMEVPFQKVDQSHLYSIFVDVKGPVKQDIKRVFQLLVKQLYHLHLRDEKTVTLRVHVGGDELYSDLIDAFRDQR